MIPPLLDQSRLIQARPLPLVRQTFPAYFKPFRNNSA
jgi:hypothetical protein